MKLRRFISLAGIVILVVAVTMVSNAYMLRPHKPDAASAPVRESALDRVLRTGVLRCGYYVFPPVMLRDPNTDQLSGFSVDMMNAIAAKTGLKIDWTEEVNFGNTPAALEAGRFDAMCTPDWPDTSLGRQESFTRPFFYAGISPLVLADNTRFDADEGTLNDPSITFVAQEGDATGPMTREAFPKAKVILLPAHTDTAILIENVLSGKADAILLDKNALREFNAHNQVKLKMLNPGHPVKAQAFVLGVYRKEPELREFLDNAVTDMLATGTIDRLLAQWEPEPGTFLRVAEPYRIEDGK